MYFTAGDCDSRRRPSALHWDALSIFLENVMSRAVTSDKVTDAMEAGVSLLKRLLLFTSTVSCHEHAAMITATSLTPDTCVCLCVHVCVTYVHVCACVLTLVAGQVVSSTSISSPVYTIQPVVIPV